MVSNQGSEGAMNVSPPVLGPDTAISTADLASLTGIPHQPELLDDLVNALGASSGFDAARPLTAEIIGGIVTVLVAAILSERPGTTAAQLPDHSLRYGMAAAVQAWRDLTGGTPVQQNRLHDVARLSPLKTLAPPADGQMCALFAVDIAGFTRPDRDDDIRRYLHEELYTFLPQAFSDAGIPWPDCFVEDRGDGALVVIPPGIAFKGIIDPLPDRLRSLIRRHNHLSRESAGLQLRAALHFGPVDYDGYGFVGSDVNLLFRMLDARPLKRALAASGAELAMIVSDYVYRNVVCRHPSLVNPGCFRAARFQVKNTRAQAWTYLPGTSA
jgi:class 3 adenylate cyclase